MEQQASPGPIPFTFDLEQVVFHKGSANAKFFVLARMHVHEAMGWSNLYQVRDCSTFSNEKLRLFHIAEYELTADKTQANQDF